MADHSLAQVRLLARAAARVRAGDGLVDLQTTHAAVAAAWSREGGRLFQKLQRQLKEAVHGQ